LTPGEKKAKNMGKPKGERKTGRSRKKKRRKSQKFRWLKSKPSTSKNPPGKKKWVKRSTRKDRGSKIINKRTQKLSLELGS